MIHRIFNVDTTGATEFFIRGEGGGAREGLGGRVTSAGGGVGNAYDTFAILQIKLQIHGL